MRPSSTAFAGRSSSMGAQTTARGGLLGSAKPPTRTLSGVSESRLGEAEFLSSYDASGFPRTEVTTDVVLFAVDGEKLDVLLIERGDHPYKGYWALPGGFIGPEEDLEDSALRELEEETGLALERGFLRQLRAYGKPGRDPRGRTVTITYFGMLQCDRPDVRGGDDASRARFWAVDDLDLRTGAATAHGPAIAFDHHVIIADALADLG